MKLISAFLVVAAISLTGTPSLADASHSNLSTVASPEFNRLGAPAAPQGLRATVYSPTAVGLVWERSTTPRLRYEIQRDGVIVGTTDGTSQVDSGLVAGRNYVYEVVALDGEGGRSQGSTLIVRTDGEPIMPVPPVNGLVSYTLPSGPGILQAKLSGPLPSSYAVRCDSLRIEPCEVSPGRYQLQTFDRLWNVTTSTITIVEDEPTIVPVAEPSGLSFTPYSTSAGALLWRRSTIPGLRHEVRRDGTLVSTTDGTNHQVRELTAGVDYFFEVIAVDRRGQRSDPARLTVRTDAAPDPEPDPEPDPDPEPEPEPPVTNTIPATTLPSIDSDGNVVWPFAPVDGGLIIELSEYARLPTARSGRQPRVNDMFHANGRLFVSVEEDGLIYDVTDANDPVVWFDVGAAIQSATGRELDTSSRFHGGLRSAAFHPGFLSNGKLYTSLMEQRPASSQGHVYLSDIENGIAADSVVVEWTVDPRSMIVDTASYREVFRVGVPEYDHPIKQIEFNQSARRGDADYGLLYIGHGDGSFASETARGGRRNDALGKILRIDPLASDDGPYRVPADNPFVGDDTMLDEVFSIGHRNPHHLSFGEDGTLLVADVGRDNIDEINVVLPGRDYGWAEREGAYVQLPSGGILDGIGPLPLNDAVFGYTYPVAGFGHAGRPGGSFVARAIVGGPVMRSESGGEPFYLYTEFARTGEVLYSHMDDINASLTQGAPAELSYARTRRASIRFDTDGDPATPAVPQDSLQALVASDRRYDGSERVDNRFGTDSSGNLFITNKRNGLIYRARVTGTP